ncbi:hypothetical protein D9M73_153770 [compost metagenome]
MNPETAEHRAPASWQALEGAFDRFQIRTRLCDAFLVGRFVGKLNKILNVPGGQMSRFRPNPIARDINGHTEQVGSRIADLVLYIGALQPDIGILQRFVRRIGGTEPTGKTPPEIGIVGDQQADQYISRRRAHKIAPIGPTRG